MAKLKNKGFSLVEVLIAIVVFSILIIPVITQLNTSLKIGSKAKRKQAAIEYAESCVEYFKKNSIEQIDTNGDFGVANTEYWVMKDMISDENVTSNLPWNGLADVQNYYANKAGYENSRAYSIREYTCSDVEIGGYKGKYDVNIKLSTKEYAKKQLASGGTYQDPNTFDLGAVHSLDASKAALLTNFSNYDETASTAFYATKMNYLKSSSNEATRRKWEQIIYSAINPMMKDTCKKTTCISVSYNEASDLYTVTCRLYYQDIINASNDYKSDLDGKIEPLTYLVYNKTFEELPPIYLMYNQCVYNESYADDYILVDKSGLDGKKDNNGDDIPQTVNVFVVGTVDTITDVKDAYAMVNGLTEEQATAESTIKRFYQPVTGLNTVKSNSHTYCIAKASSYALLTDEFEQPTVRFFTNLNDISANNSYKVGSTDHAVGGSSGQALITQADGTAIAETSGGFAGSVFTLQDAKNFNNDGRIYDIEVELIPTDGLGEKVKLTGTKGDN